MNVKPGMLARVVRNGAFNPTPGIVDRIVEIVRPVHFGEEFTTIDGQVMYWAGDVADVWVVKSANALLWAIETGLFAGRVFLFPERAIGDAYLRPIGGVPVDEEINDEVMA